MDNRKIIIYRAILYKEGKVMCLPFTRREVCCEKHIEVIRREFKKAYGATQVYFSHKQI